MHQNILPLSAVRLSDIPYVGLKNAVLGELAGHLSELAIEVPIGFVISKKGFKSYCWENDLNQKIALAISKINDESPGSVAYASKSIRKMIMQGTFPALLATEIKSTYQKLCVKNTCLKVAVRSSSTIYIKDGVNFAGQQKSYFEIIGEEALLDAVRHCYASPFTPVGIQIIKSFSLVTESLNISAGVLFMKDADSGKTFTIKPPPVSLPAATFSEEKETRARQLLLQLIKVAKGAGMKPDGNPNGQPIAPELVGFLSQNEIDSLSIDPIIFQKIIFKQYLQRNTKGCFFRFEQAIVRDFLEYLQVLKKETQSIRIGKWFKD